MLCGYILNVNVGLPKFAASKVEKNIKYAHAQKQTHVQIPFDQTTIHNSFEQTKPMIHSNGFEI